jgi:hypothetical protein
MRERGRPRVTPVEHPRQPGVKPRVTPIDHPRRHFARFRTLFP